MVRYKPLAHQLRAGPQAFGWKLSSLPQYCMALSMQERYCAPSPTLALPRRGRGHILEDYAVIYAGSASTLLISLSSRQSLRQVSPPSSLRYR